MADDRIVRVAGHVEDLRLRVQTADMLGKRAAIHDRHHHVRHEQIDPPPVLPRDPQGILDVACCEHRVPLSGQSLLHHCPHGGFVLDQKDPC